MGTLTQDLRYGLRQLRRSPGFVAVAVATLALGIGATTAVFSIVDAVLLHGSPYRNPGQLVEITTKSPQAERNLVSAGEFNDWQAHHQAFESLSAYKRWEFRVLTGSGEPDEVWTCQVSNNVFHLLGVNAILGRTFAENETQALNDAFRSAGNNPQILIKNLEAFLVRFPQSSRREAVLRTICHYALEANAPGVIVKYGHMLLEIAPDDPQVLNLLIEALARENDPASRTRAIDYTSRLIKIAEDQRARASGSAGSHNTARPWSERIAVLYAQRGGLYRDAGDLDNAFV